MYWNSQKFKLMLIISVLLVTGFIVTSFTSFFVSRASLRSEISHSELPLTSDNVYSEIQKDLIHPIFISSFMATDTFLRDWVIGGEIDEKQIVQYLKEVQVKYNTFTSFFVSEKTKNYYHVDGILKKISPDEKRDIWYYRVKKMKNDYEINVDPDLANKDALTIFINYRVFDYNTKFIGVTGVGLTVSAVKKLIENYQEKYNRTIYFLDSNGDIKLAGTNFSKATKNIFQNSNYTQLKNKLNSKPNNSFAYKSDGYLIQANIRYVDEFGWYLVVEQSEQKIIKQIYTTLIANLFICLIITIVILLLLNWFVTTYQKRIETLRGIVPICSGCKQIRDDKGYWNMVEEYVSKHTEAQFSHSICPECAKKLYPNLNIYDE